MDRIVFVRQSDIDLWNKKIDFWQDECAKANTRAAAAQAQLIHLESKMKRLKDSFHVADDAYKAKVDECRQLRKKLDIEHKARVAAERIKMETLEMLNETSEAVEFYRKERKNG